MRGLRTALRPWRAAATVIPTTSLWQPCRLVRVVAATTSLEHEPFASRSGLRSHAIPANHTFSMASIIRRRAELASSPLPEPGCRESQTQRHSTHIRPVRPISVVDPGSAVAAGPPATGSMCHRSGWNRLDVPQSRLTLAAEAADLLRYVRSGAVWVSGQRGVWAAGHICVHRRPVSRQQAPGSKHPATGTKAPEYPAPHSVEHC
jgi:hypothetical protein